LDAGKAPVQEGVQGWQHPASGKIYETYCDANNQFEGGEWVATDYRLDTIDTNLSENVEETSCAQLPPDRDVFVAGFQVCSSGCGWLTDCDRSFGTRNSRICMHSASRKQDSIMPKRVTEQRKQDSIMPTHKHSELTEQLKSVNSSEQN
jgi:hypothetical protein